MVRKPNSFWLLYALAVFGMSACTGVKESSGASIVAKLPVQAEVTFSQ